MTTPKKKLKVLCFVDNFYPVTGGINTVLDLSCRELVKYIDISVCAVKHKTYVDPPRPYEVLRAPGYYNCITNDGMAHPTKEFIKKIEDGHYDLFHCHTAGNLLTFAKKMGKKLNIPVLSTIHNVYYTETKGFVKLGFLANLITRIFFKRTDWSDYIWSVSKYCENNARKFGLKKPVKIMPNAIAYNDFSEDKVDDGCKIINKDYNLSPDTFVATLVSRIIKGKNIDAPIDCALKLKQTHPEITNIKFFIVGDGKYLKKAKQRVKKLGLEDCFIFTGMITDRNYLANIYMRSNLILFPSLMESIGLIQIEAAAYEKPTLVFENTAQCESIIDNQNGLVSGRTIDEYLDKIVFAYNNPQKLKELGKAAKKTIYRTYSDKKVTDEIINEYQKIVDDFKNKSQINQDN